MTSKKLTLVVLASTVIFKSLSRKTLQMPFLIFSFSCGVPLLRRKHETQSCSKCSNNLALGV